MHGEDAILQRAEELIEGIEAHESGGRLLPEMLEAVGAPAAEAWSVFDELAQGQRPRGLELVAGPGQRLQEQVRRGDLLVRRGLGEGRLAMTSVLVDGATRGLEQLLAEELQPESFAPGLYVQVIEGGAFPVRRADRFARRLLDAEGLVPLDSAVLRLSRRRSRLHAEVMEPHEQGWPEDVAGFRRAIESSIVDKAGKLPAPMGAAWTRAQLGKSSVSSIIGMGAAEMERIEGTRSPTIPRGATNYRVDTAQVQVMNDAATRAVAAMGVLDTSKTDPECGRVFATIADVGARTNHWRTQINALGSSNQADLLDWVIGKKSFTSSSLHATIKSATDEALAQIECFRKAVIGSVSAAVKKHKDFDDKFEPVRNFDTQLCIWVWKYFFLKNRSAVGVCGGKGKTKKFGWRLAANSTSTLKKGEEWYTHKSAHRTAWTTGLDTTKRQQEILQTSSCPGISRHHWGTDVDLVCVERPPWLTNDFKVVHKWMKDYGMAFGMSQTFTTDRPGYGSSSDTAGYDGYIEEQWHWSYYPVGQALLEWVKANKSAVNTRLDAAWNEVISDPTYASTRSGASGFTTGLDIFSHVRGNKGTTSTPVWEDYVFNVNRAFTPDT